MRQILLTITGATDTHCGRDLSDKCPRLKLGEEYPHCQAFGDRLDYDEQNPDAAPARLPECIAAESKPLGQMVAEEVEAREQIPNPRTCGVARAKPEPEWLRVFNRHRVEYVGTWPDKFIKLAELFLLRDAVLNDDRAPFAPTKIPERVAEFLIGVHNRRPQTGWSILAFHLDCVVLAKDGEPAQEFQRSDVLDAIDLVGAEILASGAA